LGVESPARQEPVPHIYFLASGGTFVLLHAFAKKTEAVPRKHLDTAEARRDDYLSRGR